MKQKHRIWAMLLALALCLSMLPTALAADEQGFSADDPWDISADDGASNVTAYLELNEDGETYTLHIDGTGSVGDEYYWEDYKGQITGLAIGAGIDLLNNIGGGYVWCTELTDITVEEGSESFAVVDGVLFNADQTALVLYPVGRTDTSYVVPESVTVIAQWAFFACDSLTEVDLSNVAVIGWEAFYNCVNLLSITIPDTMEEIYAHALGFYDAAEGEIPYGMTIYGSEGSVAQAYVEEVNAEFPDSTTFEIAVEEEIVIPFTDIADSPYADAIAAVYVAGLMNGTSETTFEPDSSLTRAMVYTIAYRMMGEPEVTGTSSFSDVADGLWYSEAIAWAAETGLSTGYTDGTFQPNTNVTREQLATVLYRYATTLGLDTTASVSLDSFSDGASVQAYATLAVQWAVACGILTSRADGTLAPGEAATRAEVALALSVMLG